MNSLSLFFSQSVLSSLIPFSLLSDHRSATSQRCSHLVSVNLGHSLILSLCRPVQQKSNTTIATICNGPFHCTMEAFVKEKPVALRKAVIPRQVYKQAWWWENSPSINAIRAVHARKTGVFERKTPCWSILLVVALPTMSEMTSGWQHSFQKTWIISNDKCALEKVGMKRSHLFANKLRWWPLIFKRLGVRIGTNSRATEQLETPLYPWLRNAASPLLFPHFKVFLSTQTWLSLCSLHGISRPAPAQQSSRS